MRRRTYRFCLFVGPPLALLAFAAASPCLRGSAARCLPLAGGAVVSPAQVRALYARLPLSFEAVPGSKGGLAWFRACGSGYGLLLGPTEAEVALASAPQAAGTGGTASFTPSATPGARLHCQSAARRGRELSPAPRPHLPGGSAGPATVVRLQWRGANAHARAMGMEELPGKVQRYVGADPRQWDKEGALFGKVRYAGVYPGIDLIYYGNQRHLEYGWLVAPGADPGRIRLAVQGARRMSLNSRGELLIRTAGGTLRQPKPRLYQERAGRREQIAGGYVLKGKDQVRFQVGPYDHSRPLVIDPTLVYASFLGGSGRDQGFGIAVDGAGGVYVTGVANLPTLWPTTRGAAQAQPSATAGGAFVTKLDLTKSGAAALVYSTYLGTGDFGTGIAVDAAGNAYLSGFIFTPTLPATPGAFQASFGPATEAAYAAKLSPSGALVYATYLGGSGSSEATGIAVDPAGNAYLTGGTTSPDFPTTPNAFQRLRPSSSSSQNVFVVKLGPTGQPLYATYLGGQQSDYGRAIATDGAGNAYVTGRTRSPDFPTTVTAIQKQLAPSVGGTASNNAFVTQFSPTGVLLYSTLLGGVGYSAGTGIAVAGAQDIFITGRTSSPGFPVTPGAFQPAYKGKGNLNAFVARISATGGLVYSTYLGGSGGDLGNGIAVDAAGDAFVTGQTASADFPVTPSGLQTAIGRAPDGQPTADAFVTVLDPQGKLLFYSTFLGGSGNDEGTGIALDGRGNLYVVGTTDSPDFRTTAGAFQPTFGGDQKADAHFTSYNTGGAATIQGDAFVAKFSVK